MSFWLSAFLGVLQGSTELLPVSSLGHAVVVPPLLHLGFRQSDPSFVPFLVLLHFATATALLILYWREWRALVAGAVRASLRGQLQSDDERLAMLLIAGTVPTAVIAVIFETQIKSLFAKPAAAAAFLIVNGAILFSAELLRRRDERRFARATEAREEQERSYGTAERLSFRAAVLVGGCQALALMPGISRSGVTIAAGLLAGLRHQEAARFAFLLATPIIYAAGFAEIPELNRPGVPVGTYVLGAALAGAVAYVSARFLIRYFRVGRLDPFALYCAGLGAVALAFAR